mmetsp:Transcript_53008/g.60743  ORF Transcript_53008/g.60743 Transcript_53008/m.60743 type:complete len:108 (-) Transcript_53008:219-542(-)
MFEKQSHRRGIDGDSFFDFNSSAVQTAARIFNVEQAAFGQKVISQSRLPVINVSYHGYVSNVGLFVHDRTYLIDGEEHHYRTILGHKMKSKGGGEGGLDQGLKITSG